MFIQKGKEWPNKKKIKKGEKKWFLRVSNCQPVDYKASAITTTPWK